MEQTLAIFDWIWKDLVGNANNSETLTPSKIGVIGELVGGSLVTMLALTECNPFKPHVAAAVVGNPILDWTDVFPLGRDMVEDDIKKVDEGDPNGMENTSAVNEGNISIPGFLTLRRTFFTKPDHFFDPFASPLLFFRTPCFELPYHSPWPPLSSGDGEDSDSSEPAEPIVLTRKRTYPRVYPPSNNAELRFPHTKILLGKDYVLRHQGLELARQMQRSDRQVRALSETERDVARRTVLTEEKNGLGLWEANDVLKAGRWLGEVLRNS